MLRRLAMILALITVVCAVPALAAAQTRTIKKVPARNTSSSSGVEMFHAYCSPCHGKAGKGDGPAAAALKNKPADLTALAKNHGGTYSDKDFEERIAGVGMTTAHGTSEMPVWGPIFHDLSGNATLRIYNLKQYIDSLQVR
jgi:mono/diheme cytochrome c family protein